MPEAGSVGAQAWNEVLAGAGEGLGFLTGAVQNTAGELESVFHNWAKQQVRDMSQAQAATFTESAHDAGAPCSGPGRPCRTSGPSRACWTSTRVIDRSCAAPSPDRSPRPSPSSNPS